ncbi:hypothetical protein BgiBS90_001328 [Biomphalaria glabrata]|nr:hypothetical protein BgiBS90_001328 [Biomphalaria glabrata]
MRKIRRRSSGAKPRRCSAPTVIGGGNGDTTMRDASLPRRFCRTPQPADGERIPLRSGLASLGGQTDGTCAPRPSVSFLCKSEEKLDCLFSPSLQNSSSLRNDATNHSARSTTNNGFAFSLQTPRLQLDGTDNGMRKPATVYTKVSAVISLFFFQCRHIMVEEGGWGGG